MLEVILLITMLSLMAKHGGRKGGRYSLRKVSITPFLTLGALVSGVAVVSGLTGTSDAQYRLISANVSWSIHNNTIGQGPISVGYAFGDYTVTEIKEQIESTASISPGNKVLGEQSNRWVRKIGQFSGATVNEVLNDGKPIKTRLNWAVQIGSVVNAFAYNNDTGNLATGSLVGLQGDLWVKDY